MRTPKERTSTSTGWVTMFSIIRRGTIMRGFGQGLPLESSTCSQGRQVARGTAYYIPFWCFTVDAGPFEQEAAGLHEYRNCYVPAIEVEAVPELAQAAGLL